MLMKLLAITKIILSGILKTLFKRQKYLGARLNNYLSLEDSE